MSIRDLILLCGAIFPAVFYGFSNAQVRTGSSTREHELRVFLRAYVHRQNVPVTYGRTRYADAFVDLDGDGEDEAVVYLAGQFWCGTGGCPTLVLKRAGTSYLVEGEIAATRPPIGVMNERSHGWRTLTAWVQGGGILQGYEAKLRFNGTRYPISAAPPSGLRLRGRPEARMLISTSACDAKNQKILSADETSRP